MFGRKRPEPPAGTVGPAWTGRLLRLPHPATPEFAPLLAAQFSHAVAKVARRPLNYSPATLATVDSILERWRPRGSNALAEQIATAGAYVGEVMNAHLGMRWVASTEEQLAEYGVPILVVDRTGGVWNPLRRVFERVDLGADSNVSAYFAQAANALAAGR